MDKIINLTQHLATPEQREQGVIEPTNKREVQLLLTFDELPTEGEIMEKSALLTLIAANSGCKAAMIGGAPYLMSALEKLLLTHGIKPVYAFSQRECVEEMQPDGSVVKKNLFKHVCFVEGFWSN